MRSCIVNVYGVRDMQVATEPLDDPDGPSLLDQIDGDRSGRCDTRAPFS
jgi:hypothetical protein